MKKTQIKAFTLIELLVVIVVVGILATISTATFQSSLDKGHQGKSYALQSQIDTLISGDCLLQGYECGKNIVPNWAFSEGDTGDWTVPVQYDIFNYKLRHKNRLEGSTLVDYITVPFYEPLVVGDIYRVDVIARKVDHGTANPNTYGGFVGFSWTGGIGLHTRLNSNNDNHMCDVFENRNVGGSTAIRLYVIAGAFAEIDEVSVRKVIGDVDINANNDCYLDFEQAI